MQLGAAGAGQAASEARGPQGHAPAGVAAESRGSSRRTSIAQLDDETTSPYFARRGEEGLLLYASSGHWLTRPIGADGAPKTKDALDVGPTGDLGLAALEAAGDG